MAEETKVTEITTEPTTTKPTEKPATPTVEELMAQLASEKAEKEKYKSASDKASSEAAQYKKQFGFDAAEHKNTVQKMFKVKSGAYMVEEGISVDGTPTASGIINGTASMVGDIPGIVKSAFFAGLLEHHDMPEEDAHELLKDYMRENKLSFRDVFMELTECMETDGFFELAGITAMQ